VRLSKHLPPHPATKYAEEGTYAHAIAADMLQGKDPPFDIAEEMYAAIKIYVDYVDELRFKKLNKPAVWIEERVKLTELHPNLFGTLDCGIFDRATETLYVIDYKHGQGVKVEAEGNVQLPYYGLGLMLTKKLNPKKFIFAIVQPRFTKGNAEPIRTMEWDFEQMFNFATDLEQAAKATDKEDAKFESGSHCRWCPAINVCPLKHEKRIEKAQSDFGVIEDGTDVSKL
jgi:hypothetical protein